MTSAPSPYPEDMLWAAFDEDSPDGGGGGGPSASYLVLEEDGTSKVTIEEGGGSLLLEESIAGSGSDTKISALTALTAPAVTDELIVASGGTTKKIVSTNLAKLMPGYILATLDTTNIISITQTVRASATTILTLASVTFDGTTPVLVEFFCPSLGTSTQFAFITLWEDSTDLCTLANYRGESGSVAGTALHSMFRYTPSAGAKVLSVRGYMNAAGTFTVNSGGGSGAAMARTRFQVSRA